MAKRTRDTAFLAGVIYFVQGLLGVSSIALPLYLRSLNWSIADIAIITSIAAFPWIFKIIFGWLSDSRPLWGFRRKAYLMLAGAVTLSGWCLLALLPPEKHWILMAMSLSNLGFAFIDVVTDAILVEHSAGVASSIYQAIAWGSRGFGTVVSGLVSGWLAAHWHPHQVFYLTMTLPLITILCAFLLHEKKVQEPELHPGISGLQQAVKLLFSPNLLNFVVILFLVSISSSFGVPFFFFMKETLKFPETFLGILSSLGWGGAVIGSFVYMRWFRKKSPKGILTWAILFNSINIFGTLMIKDQKTAFFLIFFGGAMACLVMLPIVSSAAALAHQTGVEGTLFAILMSVFNIGQIFFGFLGAKLFGVIGLTPLILTAGMAALLGLIFVRRITVEPVPL